MFTDIGKLVHIKQDYIRCKLLLRYLQYFELQCIVKFVLYIKVVSNFTITYFGCIIHEKFSLIILDCLKYL